MIDILGNDIDGRPLRAGDEVLLVKVANPHSAFKSGARFKIGGDAGLVRGITCNFYAFWPVEDQDYMCSYDSVRKLHDDHRPANESFGEMMGKFTNNRVEG